MIRFKRRGRAAIIYSNGDVGEKVKVLIRGDWVQVTPLKGAKTDLTVAVPASEIVEIIWK